ESLTPATARTRERRRCALAVLNRMTLRRTIPHRPSPLRRAPPRSSPHPPLSTKKEDGVRHSHRKPPLVRGTPCERQPLTHFAGRHSKCWCDEDDDRSAPC